MPTFMIILDLEVAQIALLASEVSRELSPTEVRIIAQKVQEMGPDLSAGNTPCLILESAKRFNIEHHS